MRCPQNTLSLYWPPVRVGIYLVEPMCSMCPRSNPGADGAEQLFLHQKVKLIKSDNKIFIEFYNFFCKYSYLLLYDTDIQPQRHLAFVSHSARMCTWCTSNMYRQIYMCTPERQITEIITQTPFTQKRIIIRFFESLMNVKHDLIYH